MVISLQELAEEFEADAELVERVALDYKKQGWLEQYEILWHEGAVYRCCADRLREAAKVEV